MSASTGKFVSQANRVDSPRASSRHSNAPSRKERPSVSVYGRSGKRGEGLPDALGRRLDPSVLGKLIPQGLVLRPEGRQTPLLEGDDELPAATGAEVEDRPVGVQAVQEQTQTQLREVPMELLGQPCERLEFAVLLRGLGIGVFDELGANGDRQPVGGDEFGLQDVMIVVGLAVGGPLQAMGTVPLVEAELARAIDDHREVPEEATVVQGLHPQQSPDHVETKALELAWRQAAQEVVQGVAVGHPFLAAGGEAVEVLQGQGAVQFKADLAAGPQFQEEHQQARPHQTPRRVDRPVRVAGIAQGVEPGAKLGPEMGDGPRKHPAQG